MLIDTQALFSGTIAADGTRAGQAITATAISTNVIDLRAPNGTPAVVDDGLNAVSGPYLVVIVNQAFNNLTSLAISLESSAAAGLTSATVHYSKTVLLAGLTAGATVVRVPLPPDDYLRYLGVRYTVSGTAPTTGTVYAFLTMDLNRNIAYPGAFTVDV